MPGIAGSVKTKGISLKDLINTLNELGSLGIHFISYDNNLDTTTPQESWYWGCVNGRQIKFQATLGTTSFP